MTIPIIVAMPIIVAIPCSSWLPNNVWLPCKGHVRVAAYSDYIMMAGNVSLNDSLPCM